MGTRTSNRPANRLAGQTSPYLLQHAHNPVDWWPWGEDAFAEARRRDVPIFLSIGYSTCYWCHVMERESFEDEAIGALMSERFVCIKVDREERPDVDDVYMAAVQAFSGHGGWPMSVFLEPAALKPFWAGTYFPAEAKYAGMPTFPHVLEMVSKAWNEHRDEVLAQAGELAEAVRERAAARHAPVKIDESHVTGAVAALLRMLDRNHGGFGGGGRGPKFPQPVFIELLLEARRAAGDEATRAAIDEAVKITLDKMACGGIFDHVGGGFHRYSVDGQWVVPHFEKMLYDNAQLLEVYAKAARVYGDAFYARVARRTAEYVLREMTDAATGAFFSAQDAEVNHREGQNYLWTREQMIEVLGEDDGALAAAVYGVDKGPNFRDPHHPDEAAGNVLYMRARPAVLAAERGMDEAALLARLDGINRRLYQARARRDQPGLDDKAIASWNGLMIRALAVSGALLDEPTHLAAAARAADFILSTMSAGGGLESPGRGLMRTYRAGTAKTPGFLEDYAFVTAGLVQLHRAGAKTTEAVLPAARDLATTALTQFAGEHGVLYDTALAQSELFVRPRSAHDGAIPSGAGAMVGALLDLAELTGDSALRASALAALVGISAEIAQSPVSATGGVRALLRVLSAPDGRAGLDAALSATSARPAPAAPDEAFTPVEVYADTDRVEVGDKRPAALRLRVHIAPGYHVNAADPAPGREAGGLVPFMVHLINGTGVAVYADYPEGEAYGAGGGPGGELRVYRGEMELEVALEKSGAWSGQPLLAVTFQPCRDDACLAARTVELDVAIDQV